MTSKRTPPGTILEIELQPNIYAYAIVLDKTETAFYRHIGSKILNNIFEQITKSGEIFTVVLHKSAFKPDNWTVIGKVPKGKEIPGGRDYKIDHMGKVSIYSQKDGSIRAATQSEVSHLETASVWEANHIEKRLMDMSNA
ncbi:Imm26 family immunity protein [Pseudomonas gingeri]